MKTKKSDKIVKDIVKDYGSTFTALKEYDMKFVTKDNGSRAKLEGGMVRDTEEGKIRWDLIPDYVFFHYFDSEIAKLYLAKEYRLLLMAVIEQECEGSQLDYWKRVADLMTRGASKYGEENWKLGKGEDAYSRYQKSLNRHLKQWILGDREEDHAAALAFNINGILYTKGE